MLKVKGDVWHLSFMQVLLRSNAFEFSLESCAKPSLKEALAPGAEHVTPDTLSIHILSYIFIFIKI